VVVRHFRDGNALAAHLAAFEEIYLPQPALAELDAGAFHSARPEKNVQQIERFLEAVDVLLPDEATPELYGRIFAQLAQAGTLIPQNDIWIAAMRCNPACRWPPDAHFGHVTGLQLLHW
jgi:predicted nucleic acid-binding protein